MQNGNAVSMWVSAAMRRQSKAQLVSHIRAQMAMDVDGREFWVAALAIAERAK